MILYTSSIIDNILRKCDQYGNSTLLLNTNGKKITGNEYKIKAINYAIFLKNKGIKKGDTIVIFIRDIITFSYIALSSLLVGAKIVLIEKNYSKKNLENKLKIIKPNFLIIDNLLYKLLKTPYINRLKQINKYRPLLQYSKNIIHSNEKIRKYNIKDIKFIENDKNSESLIVFTGGTTSNPKGVIHTLDSLEIMINRISKIIGEQTKFFYADLPHFVLIGISMGVKTVVGKNNISNYKFLKIIKKYNIDTTFSPPYRYLNIINESNQRIPNSLKNILLGSAPVYKSFLKKLYRKIGNDCNVKCIYGMTEILPVAYVDGKEKIYKNVSGDLLGKVLDGINIKIDNDGELILSGKGVFKKYLLGNYIKEFRTGDLVEYENGNLIMKGRKKDMLLRKDYNIYPSLYEEIINSIPNIIDCALVGIWNQNKEDEEVILFIEGKKINKKQIFNYLKKGKYSIDKFALPDKIIFCKLPRKGRQNKIDKNYLRNNYKYYENSNNMS